MNVRIITESIYEKVIIYKTFVDAEELSRDRTTFIRHVSKDSIVLDFENWSVCTHSEWSPDFYFEESWTYSDKTGFIHSCIHFFTVFENCTNISHILGTFKIAFRLSSLPKPEIGTENWIHENGS